MKSAETQTCKGCGLDLPLDRFAVQDSYRAKKCKACRTNQRNKIRNGSYEEYLRYAISGLKSGRRNSGLEWELTLEDAIEIYEAQEGRCALSGNIMSRHRGYGTTPFNMSIDRIDPQKGYVKSNVQLTCWEANRMKHALTPAEFFFWVRSINDCISD
jgi:hypothetical protein